MSQSATYHSFKRRLNRIEQRLNAGPQLAPGQLSADVMEILTDLRRASDDEPEIAVELALSLLETLPRIFLELDDRLGLLARALDHVPDLLVELLHDDVGNPGSVLDRPDVFERIFDLWVGDDSGYLAGLDDGLMNAVTTPEDAELLIAICRQHLVHLPLVFPAVGGNKLDLERSILQADRHRVERLLGEILSNGGNHEFAVLVARGHRRATGDSVDYVRALDRAGLEDEAIDAARRTLRNPAAPRRADVREIYDSIVSRREGHRRLTDECIAEFVDCPCEGTFEALKEVVPPSRWSDVRDQVLGTLEKGREHPDLAFELYLQEGMITEADGVVVTQPVDPHLLADCADSILDMHTEQAAGWLIVAAYHLMKRAPRVAHYRQAARWLETVKRASLAVGQTESFDRALERFKDRYRRRPALLRILDERGL